MEVGEWEGDQVTALVDNEPVTVSLADVAAAPSVMESDVEMGAADEGAENVVRSPLPGVVLSIDVAVGDSVSAGEPVCVLEAMKMEQEIAAPRDGRVKAVRVQKGQSVLIGQTIVELE